MKDNEFPNQSCNQRAERLRDEVFHWVDNQKSLPDGFKISAMEWPSVPAMLDLGPDPRWGCAEPSAGVAVEVVVPDDCRLGIWVAYAGSGSSVAHDDGDEVHLWRMGSFGTPEELRGRLDAALAEFLELVGQGAAH